MQHITAAKIGLIGLGLMGHGIGRNLLKHGFDLTVLGNVSRAPVESLVGLGATEAASTAELAQKCDVIILCVTGSPQVESRIYGENGLLAHARPGQIIIDCSTSEPSSSAKINEALAQAGVTFVDAPLGRTPVEAEAGRLNTMVGASPQVLESIRPVLAAFCENIIHVGEVLSAQKIKLINNFVIVGTASLIAEALRTCDDVGVAPASLYALMSKGPLQGGLLQATMGQVLEGHYDGMKFSINNANKDIAYFNRLVAGAANSLAPDLARVLNAAVAQHMGEQFLPALARPVSASET